MIFAFLAKSDDGNFNVYTDILRHLFDDIVACERMLRATGDSTEKSRP